MAFTDKDWLVAFFAGRKKDLYSAQTVIDIIRDAPEEDAVRVVYCKDCIHADQFNSVSWCGHFGGYMEPKNYCYYGERKPAKTLKE